VRSFVGVIPNDVRVRTEPATTGSLYRDWFLADDRGPLLLLVLELFDGFPVLLTHAVWTAVSFSHFPNTFSRIDLRVS